MLESGSVEFFSNCEYLGDRTVVSRVSGKRFEVSERCRVVDARYLAPSIPAEKPAPFDVADGTRVLPVNDLARLEESPSQYVITGRAKLRPTRAFGCFRAALTPMRSAGSAPETRG